MILKWLETNALLPSSLGQAKHHYLMGEQKEAPDLALVQHSACQAPGSDVLWNLLGNLLPSMV